VKQLFKNHPFAASGFLLATAVTLFFMIRIVTSAIYWADPAHHNETVKPWMTVGYIAKSWDLDPREIDVLAGLPTPEEHGPWTIKEIAQARGVAVQVVIDQVNATIAVLQVKKAVE
jgi:hypothetical protein